MISHYAPRRIATPVGYADRPARRRPCVVYGLWGISVLAPALLPVYDWLDDNLGWLPFFAGPASAPAAPSSPPASCWRSWSCRSSPRSRREVFAQTPRLHEEAALALGATRWEMIRMAVFPYARSGMVSAVMLGLGRALGETMAVAMVLSAGGGRHAST